MLSVVTNIDSWALNRVVRLLMHVVHIIHTSVISRHASIGDYNNLYCRLCCRFAVVKGHSFCVMKCSVCCTTLPVYSKREAEPEIRSRLWHNGTYSNGIDSSLEKLVKIVQPWLICLIVLVYQPLLENALPEPASLPFLPQTQHACKWWFQACRQATAGGR